MTPHQWERAPELDDFYPGAKAYKCVRCGMELYPNQDPPSFYQISDCDLVIIRKVIDS